MPVTEEDRALAQKVEEKAREFTEAVNEARAAGLLVDAELHDIAGLMEDVSVIKVEVYKQEKVL